MKKQFEPESTEVRTGEALDSKMVVKKGYQRSTIEDKEKATKKQT